MTLEANTASSPKSKESVEQTRARLVAELTELGVPNCPPQIIEHLLVLERNSDFNNDARTVCKGVRNLILKLKEKEVINLGEVNAKETLLAAFIGDIGKSSASEDPACQLAVVKLFSVKNIQNHNQTVRETLQKAFPDKVAEMESNLSKAGINPDTTMRAFWDKHAFWTKDIFDKYGGIYDNKSFKVGVRTVAVSHHIDRGINPNRIEENLLKPQMLYRIYIFMIVDKYQAYMYRNGGKTHEETMKYLRYDLRKKYEKSAIIQNILNTIDELGKDGTLFNK